LSNLSSVFKSPQIGNNILTYVSSHDLRTNFIDKKFLVVVLKFLYIV